MLEEYKKAVAKKALELIKDGMVIGVGSGSTVRYFIEGLAELVKGGLEVIGIPTSIDTELLLIEAGIKVGSLNEYPEPDLAVDGADSVILEKGVVIKGGGGAFLREKLVDYAAKKLILIVDERKVNREFPIPVEVHEMAISYVVRSLKELGGKPILRTGTGKLRPVVSDNGNPILDVKFPLEVIDRELEIRINAIPGVLENGIFSRRAKVLIGTASGIREIELRGL